MTVRAHIGLRLHGDGQALYGIGQLRMQIVIHAFTRIMLRLPAKLGEVLEGEFFHAALWMMKQKISMPPAYDSGALQASQSCPVFRPAA